MTSETLTYEDVLTIAQSLINKAQDLQTKIDEAHRLVTSMQEENLFVTDNATVRLQEDYSELNNTLVPFIEKTNEYSDFLKFLVEVYQAADEQLRSLWQGASDNIGALLGR